MDLVVLAAACADAEKCLYASVRCVNMAKKIKKYAAPKAPPDRAGITGLMDGEAAHPSQNNAVGTLWLVC